MATTKKTENVTENVTENTEPEMYSAAWYNEKVPVKLFKDNDKYKDDVFVCVNGRSIRIQRGKEVMIPRKFALVLEQSRDQSASAADYIEEVSGNFASEAKAHGV